MGDFFLGIGTHSSWHFHFLHKIPVLPVSNLNSANDKRKLPKASNTRGASFLWNKCICWYWWVIEVLVVVMFEERQRQLHVATMKNLNGVNYE